jgi:antitoxin (DNA-binding transcriptional repressor) of toxin-antitoxin stability system
VATMDIRELGARTEDLVRRVRDTGEVIDVVDGDVVIARMVPVEAAAGEERADTRAAGREAMLTWMRELAPLVDDLAAAWPKGVSARDAIDDVRRDA